MKFSTLFVLLWVVLQYPEMYLLQMHKLLMYFTTFSMMHVMKLPLLALYIKISNNVPCRGYTAERMVNMASIETKNLKDLFDQLEFYSLHTFLTYLAETHYN